MHAKITTKTMHSALASYQGSLDIESLSSKSMISILGPFYTSGDESASQPQSLYDDTCSRNSEMKTPPRLLRLARSLYLLKFAYRSSFAELCASFKCAALSSSRGSHRSP